MLSKSATRLPGLLQFLVDPVFIPLAAAVYKGYQQWSRPREHWPGHKVPFLFFFHEDASQLICLLFLISEEQATKEKVFHKIKAIDTFSSPLKENTTCRKGNKYLKIGLRTLFYCKRSEMQ